MTCVVTVCGYVQATHSQEQCTLTLLASSALPTTAAQASTCLTLRFGGPTPRARTLGAWPLQLPRASAIPVPI